MKFLKDNLPWMAPTAAVVLLATGYLDRDSAPVETAAAVPQVAPPVFREPVSALDAIAASAPEVADVPSTSEQITALVEQANAPDVTRSQPISTSIAPEPDVVAQETDDSLSDPAAFFASAQANLAANDFCADDLRALAAEARVYFPSGGLAGADAGLAQARLLSKVVLNCPGYAIRVEGHSDPSGDPRINLELSKQRAEAVISRIAASGIDTSKLIAVGYGDTQPSNVQGVENPAYYDRRVEFTVVEQEQTQLASFSTTNTWQPAPLACAADLSAVADQVKVYYAPRSITVPSAELSDVMQLAVEAAKCDGAKIRIVGQHAQEPGLNETVTTGRHRALAIMNSLVAAGISADQILIGAPSWSESIPGQPGLPSSRVDIQIVPVEG